MTKSVQLPQVSDVDAALAAVCAIPPGERAERRVSVHALLERSMAVRELETGVSIALDGSAETARSVADLALAERECCAQFTYTVVFSPLAQGIELRVETAGALIVPLKQLYLGLSGVRPNG